MLYVGLYPAISMRRAGNPGTTPIAVPAALRTSGVNSCTELAESVQAPGFRVGSGRAPTSPTKKDRWRPA